MTLKTTYLFSLSLVFISLGSMAQDTLTLDEAIAIGMENNFSIKISRNNKELAKKNYQTSYATFLPTVTTGVTWTESHANQDQVRTRAGVDFDTTFANLKNNNLTADVTARWVIFDGLGMFSTYQKFNMLFEASDLQQKAEIEAFLSNVSSVYYKSLLEQEKLLLLENSLILSYERVQLAKSKFEVGKASKVEYLAAQVDFNTDRSTQLAQTEVLYNQKLQLNRLMGRPTDIDFTLYDKVELNKNLSDSLIIEDAISKNIALQFSRKMSNVSYLSLKELKSNRFPTVSLFGSYNYTTNENAASFAKYNKSIGPQFGVSASVTLFNGLTQVRQEQAARVEYENSQLMQEESKMQLIADIRSVYFNYQNNLRLLELEEQNLAIARENTSIAIDRYKLGNSNALELREAQQNALLAENRFLNAAYQVKLAEIELQRLGGNLLE